MDNNKWGFLNNIKIKNKLIMSYIIIAILTVSIIGVYSAKKMKEIVIERTISDAETNVDIMQYRLEEILKLATRVSDMLYSDQYLKQVVMTQYKSYGDVVNAYNSYSINDNYLKYYDEIENITLYVENDTLLSGTNIIKVCNDIPEEDWYKKAIEDDGKISWSYSYDDLSREYHLSLIREIKDDDGAKVGVLVIDLNSVELDAIININDNKSFLEINNKKISPYDNTDIDISNYSVIHTTNDVNMEKSIIKGDYDGEESYVLWTSFKTEKDINDEFGSLIVLPESEIMRQANQAIFNIGKIVLLSIIVSFILMMYFSKNLSNRIKLLRQEMHRVVVGDFSIRDAIQGKDEIGQLYGDLNVMIASINKLINEVYVEKIQKEKLKTYQKEVEFQMLSNQINPHFLYNTLETIRMKAYCNGDKEIADIVKKLGKLMRRNLEVKGKEVTLDSELKLVSDYLEIQAMRFEGKVEYEVECNENVNTKEYQILPLLIQPIVENAFVHGLEEKKGKGKIVVRIFYRVEELIIEVLDNGVGIDKDKLRTILKNFNENDENKKRIGMKNIHQRIKIYYGNKYGLDIESEVNVGTKVIICLPKKI